MSEPNTPAVAEATKPAGPMSAEQAAAMVAARRAGAHTATPQTPEPPAKPAAASAETENPEEPEAQEEASVEGDEQPEDDSDEQAEEQDGDGDDSDFAVEVDGEEVTLKELVEAHKSIKSFQADYTRKTQALASDKKAFEAEKSELLERVKQAQNIERTAQEKVQKELESINELRQQHLMSIAQLQQKLYPELEALERVNWDRLIEEDPIQAQKLQLKRDRIINEMRANQRHMQQLQAQQAAEVEKSVEEQRSMLRKHVADKHPDLVDPEKGQAFWTKMVKAAEHFGYAEDDIKQTLDPRGFDMWVAATRYWAAQSEKDAVLAKKDEPKRPSNQGIKIVKQQARRYVPPPAAAAAEGRTKAQLMKTNTFEDAVAHLQAKRANAARKRG